MNFFAVFLGGAIGAVLRYFIILWVPDVAVLWAVNLLGSFIMGIFQAYYMRQSHPTWKLFWTTGLLGSFTTFSSFSAEWFIQFQISPLSACFYALAMTISCFVVAYLGFLLLEKREGAN